MAIIVREPGSYFVYCEGARILSRLSVGGRISACYLGEGFFLPLNYTLLNELYFRYLPCVWIICLVLSAVCSLKGKPLWLSLSMRLSQIILG